MSRETEWADDSSLHAQETIPASQTTPHIKAAEAEVAEDWNVGEVILDLYLVKGVLGEGGMGKVYRVHHQNWNIDLAVKTPRPEIINKAGAKENFVREAETWVNLGLHPHTVSCYYVRDLGGIPRVFAEYVEGGSLADWIRTRKLYEGGPEEALKRILDMSIQFAWGLHYAHEQGLVHQDVKPANVMMTPEGVAKVTDFGLTQARALTGEAGQNGVPRKSVVVAGAGLMTQAYASPEQAKGEPLTRRTDIWSWAVSVLEMFSGEVRWISGSIALDALEEYLDTGAGEAHIPQMPEALAALLRQCLQAEPDRRPGSVAEIAEKLQSIFEESTGNRHSRPVPKPAELTADTLNNRAISMLDLGKQEDAIQAWRAALSIDPKHCASLYNQGLTQWRRGQLTDDVLVEQLESARETQGHYWEANYLLALLHIERGDLESAEPLLEQALALAPKESEVLRHLNLVRSGELTPGSCVRILPGHTAEVDSLGISRDGRLVASGNRNNLREADDIVRVWEVSNGRRIGIFEGHTRSVTSVSLSANGERMLSGSEDGTLRVWDVVTGRCLRVFELANERFSACAISDDGRLALAGSANGSLRLWDVATGRCLGTLREPQIVKSEGGIWLVFVNSLSISADGNLAASGHRDGIVRLWEIPEGRCVREFKARDEVQSVCLSPDGRQLLSCTRKNTLELWDTSDGQCVQTIVEPDPNIHATGSASFSAGARLAVSASPFRLWALTGKRCLRTFEMLDGDVTSIQLNSDARLAVSGGSDGTVRIWQLPRPHHCPFHLSRVSAIGALQTTEGELDQLLALADQAFDQREFAAGLAQARNARSLPGHERNPRNLNMWARTSLVAQRIGFQDAWISKELARHADGEVESVSFSRDGRIALSTSRNTMGIFEMPAGLLRRVIEVKPLETGEQGLFGPIRLSLAGPAVLSSDGRCVLAGLYDCRVGVWDAISGDLTRIFESNQVDGRTEFMRRVCVSSDGRWVLGASASFLYLWEFATGRCLRTLHPGQAGTTEVRDVCLSPDGQWALAAYMDSYPAESGVRNDDLRLWDLSSGKCVRVFKGHHGGIGSTCFSLDGRAVFSTCGPEGSIRQWEVSTGQCVRVFESTDEAPCLTADGRWLITKGYRDLNVWDLNSGSCVRNFKFAERKFTTLTLSQDSRFALTGSPDGSVLLWELDWDLDAPQSADWDEGARPHLEIFLTQHTPYSGELPPRGDLTDEEITMALTRHGQPTWTEGDFKQLLYTLACAGYGWLRPEGVRRELERMTADYKGPISELSEQVDIGRDVIANDYYAELRQEWFEFCTRCGARVRPYRGNEYADHRDAQNYDERLPDVANTTEADTEYWCQNCQTRWRAFGMGDTGRIWPCGHFTPFCVSFCAQCGCQHRA